jgi:hypothetical protein
MLLLHFSLKSVIFKGKVLQRLRMSKWYGVHNDEDEVAYSMDKPKIRYEYKQARCRVSQSVSTSAPKKSSISTKSLSIKKMGSSLVCMLLLKKRLKVVMTF